MRPEIARSKGWGGNYWKVWYESMNLMDTAESTEGLPPSADEDRHVGPADHAQQQQGGPIESKLASRVGQTSELQYPADVLQAARSNFSKFYRAPFGGFTDERMEQSSLGIVGWSEETVLDYDAIDNEKANRSDGNCCAFGHAEDVDAGLQQHNENVVKLIEALGQSGAGRRAILKAIAERQGVTDEAQLEDMYAGKGDVKLHVPMNMRRVLREVGLGDALAEINILTVSGPQEILATTAWEDIEFEVALDSGSVVHVCAPADIPGYRVEESPGSKRGQDFLMGDGGTIPNLGQSQLNLSEGAKDMQSVFQIAAVTRPLMSVGRICDQGHSITFDAVMAVVNASDGTELCRFERQSGGLYVAKLKLRNPLGFGGPE